MEWPRPALPWQQGGHTLLCLMAFWEEKVQKDIWNVELQGYRLKPDIKTHYLYQKVCFPFCSEAALYIDDVLNNLGLGACTACKKLFGVEVWSTA